MAQPQDRRSSPPARATTRRGLRRLAAHRRSQAPQGRDRARRRLVPDRDRVGPDLGHAVQHAYRRGLRPGRRCPGRVHVRHDRARGVLRRVRGNGEEEDHGGRLLLLHQPRARPGTGHRHRLRLGGRLLGVRGVAGRRFRLLPEPEAEPVRGEHRLALAGAGHGADHQHPDLLRRPDLQHGARDRADQRGRHPAHLRRLPARPRPCDRGPAQPCERLQGLPSGGQARGGRDRHRPVLRLLVLGRLRDGAELRRGIPRPQADRPPRPVHLGDRARRVLHDHVLGLARRVSRPPRRRSPSRRPTRPSTTSPRPATTPGNGWPR